MLHWDIQKTQPLRKPKVLGLLKPQQSPSKPEKFDQTSITVKKPVQEQFEQEQFKQEVVHTNVKESTLVVFVAHRWSPDIQLYYKTLEASCKTNGLDLVILACGPYYKLDFPAKIFRPLEKEVLELYGYLHNKGLWACNHLILMWLWDSWAKEEAYEKIWSIEYDVRTTGPLETLWDLDSAYDYICCRPIEAYKTESFWGPNKSGFKPTHTSLKQVFRLSSRFIHYLHEEFKKGNSGQDECTLATHAQKFNSTNLSKYLCLGFSPCKSARALASWHSSKNIVSAPFKIFHPIK